MAQQFEQGPAVGAATVGVVEESVPPAQVLELGAAKAGSGPRQVLERTRKGQLGEKRQPGFEEAPVKVRVVGDQQRCAGDERFDPGLV